MKQVENIIITCRLPWFKGYFNESSEKTNKLSFNF